MESLDNCTDAHFALIVGLTGACKTPAASKSITPVIFATNRSHQLQASHLVVPRHWPARHSVCRGMRQVARQNGARRELEATLTEKDRHIRQMDEKATNATNTQKELEAVLREKDSRIRQMEKKAIGSNPDKMAALMEILQRKEAELEEIKTRFQDFKKIDKVDVHRKSTPVQTNNTSTTPNIVVVQKSMNSSSAAIPIKSEEKRSGNTTVVESAKPEEKRPTNATSVNTTVVNSAKPEEKRPANTTVVESAKPEEKRPANTTVVESKRLKDRSIEEKLVKFTTNMEDDGVQGNLNDFDDIYGESHSKKSGSPRRNKKFMTNDLDSTGQSGNSLDQDSDRVRYNRLLEKENAKLSKETKKNNTNGSLEKISKASLDHGGHTTSEKVVQGMAGAADVKPSNKLLNNDEAKQENRKQKKKKSNKSKKKKMADTADTNVGGEVAKQRVPDATSI
ncbi:hypothetical protein PVAP13_9KG117300 [Panicum virgatum]|uniref:Uncharacterized protein n=1 Tax=Panicum virgatum TaxID=38727 RepID=A0A8T0NHU3_PANVG|nr:hypothetical protein PVAP13_9KG117300 [Panicum virgatum]